MTGEHTRSAEKHSNKAANQIRGKPAHEPNLSQGGKEQAGLPKKRATVKFPRDLRDPQKGLSSTSPSLQPFRVSVSSVWFFVKVKP